MSDKKIETLEARTASAGPHVFDKRAADALAREVQKLIDRKVIDSRSPAADALLDYVDPGPNESVPEKLAAPPPPRTRARSLAMSDPCDTCPHFDGLLCGPSCEHWQIFLKGEAARRRATVVTALVCFGLSLLIYGLVYLGVVP